MAHRLVHIRYRVLPVAASALFLGAPALAVTDWSKDGRVGYPEREMAVALARAFTAEGAPYEGQVWRVVEDPDGGWTPVFRDMEPLETPSS